VVAKVRAIFRILSTTITKDWFKYSPWF